MDVKTVLLGIGAGILVGTICETANYISSRKKNLDYLNLIAKDSVRQVKEGGKYGS